MSRKRRERKADEFPFVGIVYERFLGYVLEGGEVRAARFGWNDGFELTVPKEQIAVSVDEPLEDQKAVWVRKEWAEQAGIKEGIIKRSAQYKGVMVKLPSHQ